MESRIKGLQFYWREGVHFDALRAQVYDRQTRRTIWISSKTNELIKQINDYLRHKKLHKSNAISDAHFVALKERFAEEMKLKHGLTSYLAKKRVELKTKEFDFDVFLNLFFKQKSQTTAVANSYLGWLKFFWMPLLREKYGCEHPSQFINFEGFIEDDIRQAKTRQGKPYSPHTYSGLTSAFNEFMKFLKKKKVINQEAFFLVYVETDTLEQEKRGKTVSNRGKEYYKSDEIYEIKKKIDHTFPTEGDLSGHTLKENKKWKLRAYAILLGCCMGLRRGNIIGLKAEDLHPENQVPYLITSDNIVVGHSRAEKGALKLENSTKTFKGRVELPFIQPDVDTLVELANYIKSEVKKGYILTGGSKTGTIFPDSFNAFWRKISERAKFRYVHPHGFKHGYASRGAVKLGDWYNNSVYFLHRCCMHSKFETTQNYIKSSVKDGFIDEFKFLKKKSK